MYYTMKILYGKNVSQHVNNVNANYVLLTRVNIAAFAANVQVINSSCYNLTHTQTYNVN